MYFFWKSIVRSNLFFYLKSYANLLIPKAYFRFIKNRLLKKSSKYSQEIIAKRVNYYAPKNKVDNFKGIVLKDLKKPKRSSIYFFDLRNAFKYFPLNKQLLYKFGDVDKNLDHYTITKSRPIHHNGNLVVLKLNAIRHYNFIKDKKKFAQKKETIVWRGYLHKENRKILVQKFFNHPKCDVGEFSKKNTKWSKPFLSIQKQLESKFILSIEGNDVATNLKWIMSSNSLCFMPKPKFETWYMEGLLVPNKHYVEIKDDYSDMIEKMEYYATHITEAEEIIKNANDWTKQFKDKTLEKIVSIKVLERYFENTNQK